MENEERYSGEVQPEISEVFTKHVENKGYNKTRALEGAMRAFMAIPAGLQVKFMSRDAQERQEAATVLHKSLEQRAHPKKRVAFRVIAAIVFSTTTIVLVWSLFSGIRFFYRHILEPVTFFNGLEPVISKSTAIYLVLLAVLGLIFILIAAARKFRAFIPLTCGCVLLLASIGSLCYRLTANPLVKDVKISGFKGYLCYGPDDNLLIGMGNGNILCYDSKVEKVLQEYQSSQTDVDCLAVSYDGQRLAASRENGSIELIELPTGKLLKTIAITDFRATDSVFSPDSQKLAVFVNSEYQRSTNSWRKPEEGNLWIYSAKDGELLFCEKTPVMSSSRQAMDWKGNIIAMIEAHDGGRGALLWDAEKHVKLHNLVHPEFGSGPLSVALSPDAQKVAVGYAPYDVAIWDVGTGKLLHDLVSRNNWVVCLDFSPDGRLLASGEGNSAVRLWDVESGSQLFHFGMGPQNYSNYTYSVSFDSKGRQLACGTANNHVVIWRIPD